MIAEVEILLIADEISSLRLLTEVLEREGYRVRPTGNARLAFESALARPPTLVITEVGMPEIDGFELCRRLKEDERTRSVPVIFISSLQDTDDRVRGFEVGGADFITKPLREEEVLARVRAHTLLPQMQQHLENLVEERAKKLRESEERYELAVAGSAAGIWDWDIPSGKIHYSGRFKQLLGYGADEPWSTTDDFWERLHPDDVQAVRAAVERHLEHREPYREDFRLQTRSGEYRWFYARGQALWDESGKPLRMAGSITDITGRKEAEEELRKSEERYELVAEASGVGLWDWDLGSGMVYLSDHAKELLGYPPGEGRKNIDEFWGMIHPDDLQGVKAALDMHFEEDTPYDRDYRFRTSSGEYRWFNVRGQTVRDEAGKPFRSLGSIADITERKQAQEKILGSERRFRSLMEQSPLAMTLVTLEGENIQVNSAWQKLWGFDDDEAAEVMKNYNLLRDEQLRNLGLAGEVRKAFAGENVMLPPIEYIGQQTIEELNLGNVKAESAWIQIHLNPIRNEEEEVEFIVGTIVDITELKLAEEALRISEANLIKAQEVGLTGSWHLDVPENILTWSDETYRIFGVAKGTPLTYERFQSIVHPEDRDMVDEKWQAALNGEPYDIEHRLLVGDEVKWVREKAELKFDDGGKPTRGIGIAQDITERKKIEEESRRQRELLSRVERTTSMGQLAGSIAHELNQPLTGVLSNAQAGEMLIKKGRYDREELAKILSEIESDAKRASEVIRSLRNLYREQPGDFRPYDINEVVEETAQLLHSELVMNRVDFTTTCAPSVPPISGNRVQIQQVLVNLIMNAIEAMKAVAADDRRIRVATVCGTGKIRVSVEDSGPGISADRLDRIFEPLATWKPGGTGMGLAISNSIIDSHGGKMWAENRPERGALVVFALPLPQEGRQS